MRLIVAASTVFVVALAVAASSSGPSDSRTTIGARHFTVEHASSQHVMAPEASGSARRIFRHDTFGDEQLWTDVLRMHEVIATVSPSTALAVGLKVDVEALPRRLSRRSGPDKVDLNDPAVTVELLRLECGRGRRG